MDVRQKKLVNNCWSVFDYSFYDGTLKCQVISRLKTMQLFNSDYNEENVKAVAKSSS